MKIMKILNIHLKLLIGRHTADNNNQIMIILPPLNIYYYEINKFLENFNYVINQCLYSK